jgi:hypothetical protein
VFWGAEGVAKDIARSLEFVDAGDAVGAAPNRVICVFHAHRRHG